MLTKLTIRNFKLFENVAVELGNLVVLIGPNIRAPSAGFVGYRREEMERETRHRQYA
jgi:predicted ATPase